jgi:hypothetical protein
MNLNQQDTLTSSPHGVPCATAATNITARFSVRKATVVAAALSMFLVSGYAAAWNQVLPYTYFPEQVTSVGQVYIPQAAASCIGGNARAIAVERILVTSAKLRYMNDTQYAIAEYSLLQYTSAGWVTVKGADGRTLIGATTVYFFGVRPSYNIPGTSITVIGGTTTDFGGWTSFPGVQFINMGPGYYSVQVKVTWNLGDLNIGIQENNYKSNSSTDYAANYTILNSTKGQTTSPPTGYCYVY